MAQEAVLLDATTYSTAFLTHGRHRFVGVGVFELAIDVVVLHVGLREAMLHFGGPLPIA